MLKLPPTTCPICGSKFLVESKVANNYFTCKSESVYMDYSHFTYRLDVNLHRQVTIAIVMIPGYEINIHYTKEETMNADQFIGTRIYDISKGYSDLIYSVPEILDINPQLDEFVKNFLLLR